MISKELLSEVLGEHIIKIWSIHDSILSYTARGCIVAEAYRTINVHELSHKCKEWAKSQGYSTGIIPRLDKGVTLKLQHRINSLIPVEAHITEETYDVFDTEPEAIFKACQWILDNKEPV